MSEPQSFDELFAHNLRALMADMQTNIQHDPEMLGTIGFLAHDVLTRVRQPSWQAMKEQMNMRDFREMSDTFRKQGEHALKSKNRKLAYSYEILVMSLMAKNFPTDEFITRGNHALDAMIQDTVNMFRKGSAAQQKAKNKTAN